MKQLPGCQRSQLTVVPVGDTETQSLRQVSE